MADATKKHDVAILGWWYGKNYGSILTYYGLNRALQNLGHSVLMVHEPLGYNGYRVKWPDDIISMKFARRMGYDYTSQEHFSQLPSLNDKVKTFIVGSDQLWNPLIGRVNDDLFLNFVSLENKRVAYATSFGNKDTTKFKSDFVSKHSKNLRNFDAISVREGYAVDTAKNVFGVDATQVIDPVFLITKGDYEYLADQSKSNISGKYLAAFFLDPNEEKKNAAISIADKLGFDKIVIIPNPDEGRKFSSELFKEDRFEFLESDAPENFLHAYKNSGYVVTDSFHGTAFSVIFNKPFSSIYNQKRGVDRFENLLNALKFGNTRRVREGDSASDINNNANVTLNVDFTKADQYIREHREKSISWLKSALSDATLRAESASPATAATQSMPDPNIRFSANNDIWKIAADNDATRLSVSPGPAVRGNFAWCGLPTVLETGKRYRLEIDWILRTGSPIVNLHVRNAETGDFRVIGSLDTSNSSGRRQTDAIEFIAPKGDFGQFMLGALHFTGHEAGADIFDLSIKAINADPAKIAKAASPNYAQIATDLALKDNERFIASYGAGSIGRAQARLMFHSHAIEKGLSRSDFRPGFGKIAVPNLAKEMNNWIASKQNTDDQFFKIAASVMHTYFNRHNIIDEDVSDFWNLFSKSSQAFISKADNSHGGVLTADSIRETTTLASQDRYFLDVVYGRRSVREFTEERVTNQEIKHAIQIAMQAPSVCNRQPGRVHYFEDPVAIKAALDIQGGFSGYKMPGQLFLITSDLTAFLFAAERNQAFIDGGLFMMSLLLGLEQMKIGSCCLNTAMNTEREGQIRKILGIPETETFIAFVAIGHYDRQVLTPQSKRLAVEKILVEHRLPEKIKVVE